MRIKASNNKVTFTKANQRKAVNRTFSLVKKGNNITSARKIVATELEITPNTLWVWQNKFGMTVPRVLKTNNLVEDHGIAHQSTQSRVTPYGTITEMASDVRGVLKSIISQDGRFSTTEAGVVGKLYTAELSRMKLQVEVHKINSKLGTEHIAPKGTELLSLN